MRRNLEALADREFDVVVVGGGIFGVALAWEAVSRGLSTALIERGDFCEAASANSFKMVHGGIRYLQHGDLPRVRESCEERSSLMRIAPHQVRPLPIVVPTYGHLLRGKAAMRAAMATYDLLTVDRNRGIRDPLNHIPRGRTISRAECLAEFPFLQTDGLTGAALFHDGQMYNPTRLALSFVRSAAAAGAEVANHVEATGFLRDGNRIFGVSALDRTTGASLAVRGRIVLNAAGGWAARLLGALPEVRLSPAPTFSRDACFVVRRRLLGGDRAVAVQGATSDPDSLLSRGERHLFIVPWRDYTLVGVWHVVYDGDPDRMTVGSEELERWLDEINAAAPGLGLGLEDVSLWNAGLVLFGENAPGASDLSYGKRSWILDQASDGIDGLVTVLGVRYTTAKGVAERAIDLVFRKMGHRPPRSSTASTPIFGGDFDRFDDLLTAATTRSGRGLAREDAVALLRNHGSRYGDVLRHLEGDRPRGTTVTADEILRAEVLHAVSEEMALTLGDTVFRRTDLGTGAYPGDEKILLCASLMASKLGWDSARVDEEVRQVRSRFFRLPS